MSMFSILHLFVLVSWTRASPLASDDQCRHSSETGGCGLPADPSLLQVGIKDHERSSFMEQPGPLTCAVPKCDRVIHSECKDASCCSTRMFEGLSQITDWFDVHGIKYVILAGTLLGAHRANDVIPWTSDLDIGIFQNDSEAVFKQKDIPFRFNYDPWFSIPRGCEARLTPADKQAGVEYIDVTPTRSELASGRSISIKGGYDIDLYLIDDISRGKKIHEKCLKPSGGSYREDLRTTQVTIRGRKFSAPAEVEAYLECKYGKSWRTPDPEHNWGAFLQMKHLLKHDQ